MDISKNQKRDHSRSTRALITVTAFSFVGAGILMAAIVTENSEHRIWRGTLDSGDDVRPVAAGSGLRLVPNVAEAVCSDGLMSNSQHQMRVGLLFSNKQPLIDCNSNGIPDACDIDCDAPDEQCDLKTCGQSADCNNNGVPDECDIADGTSGDCNLNGVPDECDIENCLPEDPSCQDCNDNGCPDECDLAPSIAFSEAPTLLLSPHPNSMLSTAGTLAGPRIPLDVNNDNVTDLAVLGHPSPVPQDGLVTVFTGNGDPEGTFSLGIETALNLITTISLTAGDCNKDNAVDLFVSARLESTTRGLYLLRNILQDGTFADAVTIDNTDGFLGTAVADFDRDSFLDIAALTHFGGGAQRPRLQVFENLGACMYAAPVPFAEGVYHGVFAVTDDFNNDSWPDVAISIQNPGVVAVFLNTNTGPAPGSVDSNLFGAPDEYLVGDSSIWVSSADLDADSHVDIVVANTGQYTNVPSVAILWNKGDGTGTFLPAQQLPSGSGLQTFAIADLDGDGDLDIALGVRNHPPYILENLGDRNFAPAKNFGNTGEGTQRTIAAGDFDEDGRADLAVLGQMLLFPNEITILLNDYGPFSEDCNDNSIPDECEEDCNENGVPDDCDIADCPEDDPGCQDCDDNSIPDECDIANGTSGDANNNGIPDECEACEIDAMCDDGLFCNGEETCDVDTGECEPGTPPCDDGVFCNGEETCDEAADVCEPGTPPCAEDEVCCEEAAACQPDCNGNGVGDTCEIDTCPPDEPDCTDCNGNGIPDECDIATCEPDDLSCQDCQPNGIPDGCEPDCYPVGGPNGIPDDCDITACPEDDLSCQDCNGNGIPDECDLDECPSDQAECEPEDPACRDCNGNGIPDECDITACPEICNPSCGDCNSNGVPDQCDLDNGCSADVDPESGILDECEECPADINGDGCVGPFDLALLLASWGPCESGDCPPDLNLDCEIGPNDLAILLASWGPCCGDGICLDQGPCNETCDAPIPGNVCEEDCGPCP